MKVTQDQFDELVAIAYQANNHARRMVNKYCPNKERPDEWAKIDKRAQWLSDNIADKDAPKIVQS